MRKAIVIIAVFAMLAVLSACKQTAGPVKEFTMTSFTEIIDGKYFPQYSLKEITVNKGDRVRIKITVTSGAHDFKIDEFNAYAETPLDQQVTVEFVADKAGTFEYYCTKPGHRQNGH
jgi:nitrite reductase (NO-forming)